MQTQLLAVNPGHGGVQFTPPASMVPGAFPAALMTSAHYATWTWAFRGDTAA